MKNCTRYSTTLPVSVRCHILYVDLDNFERVNDTLGHQDGDVPLKKLARRLVRLLESGQEQSRISGDELVILLQGAFAHYMASDLANRIVRDFELTCLLRISASASQNTCNTRRPRLTC